MSQYNPFSLEGKTILITGASSGIGKQTAIECSRMGATVIVTGRNAERLADTFSQLEGDREHKQVIADLSTEEGIQSLVAKCPALQGAFLCAGVGMALPIKFCTPKKVQEIFQINFFSPVELARLLFSKKKLQKNSSLVFVSSISGGDVNAIAHGIYGASKAALSKFMKTCALEFAQGRMVRVNALMPGMVETPLIQAGSITEEQLEADKQSYPLKRYGTSTDIAHAAVYLLSDASSWVTGQNLVIDGGATL